MVTYERKSQPEIQLQYNDVTIVIESMSLCSSANRVDVLGCSGSMLIQAIRSHIYFSQLSAWLSRSKGSIPSRVIYRSVLTPDQSDTTNTLNYSFIIHVLDTSHLYGKIIFMAGIDLSARKKPVE